MSDLKRKTISGLTWSFIDFSAKQGSNFVIGIILARLLSPAEFGLIGLALIFIAISRTFVDSGFTQALIRKNDCTDVDYSTVFFFNVLVGIVTYSILVLFAGSISRFFDEPELKQIVEVLGIGLVINAFVVVHMARLTKEMNFKLQAKISIFSVTVSGIIGIAMAYQGYGVWSLVAKTLAGFIFTTLLLWVSVKWKPSFLFSMESFFEMFSFGSKLLINGLLNTLYKNIYLIIIGKYYSTAELGFYTRADQFKNILSENITGVVQRVSYPALSVIQADLPRLKSAYKKVIKSTVLITFPLMLGMAAVAEPMILVLIGEKWISSVKLLQLLCFVGMLYPIHAINLNMLLVQGDSSLFLKLSILRKLFVIPVVFLGVYWGIEYMILGMLLNSIIFLFVHSYYSGKAIEYSSLDQLLDILPALVCSSFMALVVFVSGFYLTTPIYISLIIQVVLGIFLMFFLGEIFRFESYRLIREVGLDYLKKKYKRYS